jgi:PST family polysaccharide transporter
MNLAKTSVLSAIATMVRIITGIIITKVIAVFVGPAGLAIIGQLQNVINVALLTSGDFLKTAITKYTAEYSESNTEKYELWSASFNVVVALCVFMFCFLNLFSHEISFYFLKTTKYSYVLRILSISLPFFLLNTILLSILNGQREIKKFISLNILLSIMSLLIVGALSYFYGLKGALIAYVTNQSIVLFISIVLLRNEPWLKFKNFLYKCKYAHYKKLFGFALITFTSIMAANVSIIYIRGYIIDNISEHSAGNWQAMWSLSQMSIALITTSLATYMLPVLTRLNDITLLNRELKSTFKLILPVVLFISFMMYYFRELIITILYTAEFHAMKDLFFWQFVGVSIKVCGWVFGYVLVAKEMVKYSVLTEVVFALIWCTSTKFLIDYYGVIGSIYAYVLVALLHLFTMFLIYKYKIH